jgi:hypothetical protein
MVLATAVLLVAIVAAAAQGEQSLPEGEELEEGWVPVADQAGNRTGFVKEEDFYDDLPPSDGMRTYWEEYEAEHGEPPPLSIYPPPGEDDPPVYDASGERIVGYFVPILGFMSVEEYEAFDFEEFFEHPKVVENVERTHQLEEELLQEELRERDSDGGW